MERECAGRDEVQLHVALPTCAQSPPRCSSQLCADISRGAKASFVQREAVPDICGTHLATVVVIVVVVVCWEWSRAEPAAANSETACARSALTTTATLG